MKNKFLIAPIWITTAILLLPFSACFSNVPFKDLAIPSRYGIVQEVFRAQTSSEEPEKIVILIQDAHCNYEAQKNLANILEFLIQENKLRLIMVEGGSDDLSISFLRAYADTETLREAAEKYLRAGKISGEEYLDIAFGYDIELYGVENEDAYSRSLDIYREIEPFREQALGQLQSLSAIVAALKPVVYNARLREFEGRKNDFCHHAISLAEYSVYLEEVSARQEIGVDCYPNLKNFAQSRGIEQALDVNRAESERDLFLQELMGKLNEEDGRALVQKTKDLKRGALTPQEYYSYVLALAKGVLETDAAYPALSAYIEYVNVNRAISAKGLLRELRDIEKRIAQSLCADNNERRLLGIDGAIAILEGFLNLTVAPDEYEAFKSTSRDFVTASWVQFLGDLCRRFRLAERPAAATAMDDTIEKFAEFYRLSEAREKAFIHNLTDKMETTGDTFAALIAGGFHTPGISRLLQEEGYSYAVVTPRVTRKADAETYFSVLQGIDPAAEEIIDAYAWTEPED